MIKDSLLIVLTLTDKYEISHPPIVSPSKPSSSPSRFPVRMDFDTNLLLTEKPFYTSIVSRNECIIREPNLEIFTIRGVGGGGLFISSLSHSSSRSPIYENEFLLLLVEKSFNIDWAS